MSEQTERHNRTIRADDIMTIATFRFMSQDLIRFVCGDKIGEGAYRAVFLFDLLPNMVIKVTHHTSSNILENEIWQAVKDTPNKKWFAPCHFISPCGHFLIQEKVRKIEETDKLPKKMPDVFTDIKKENFGFMGDQLVCHDYQFITRALDSAFMTSRPVNWK